jgi:glutamate dehydrogenase
MHASVVPDESRVLRSIPATRLALIERIARAAAAAGGRSQLQQRFVRCYFRGVGEEDLTERTPEMLAHAALGHLRMGSRRLPGQALVTVFNPQGPQDGFESPHTVVRVITDDMPFLVDSLGIVFSRAQLAVHLIVHPVLTVHRDARGRLIDLGANGSESARPESWQLYEIDRQMDRAEVALLKEAIEATLGDVRVAVLDWDRMRERARELIASLDRAPPSAVPAEEVSETRSLIAWMEDRQFVFLGYRTYRLLRGPAEDRLAPEHATGLGILRPGRRASKEAGEIILRGEARSRARQSELLVLTKANSRSTVHRPDYLDHVGLKIFDARGRICGEHLFLGLWTSTAYQRSPREIPVLRRKVQHVIQHFGLDPASHDGKAVLNVLETYPRDELFQAGVEDLIRIVRDVVNLYERRTVRVLARRDPYHRFYSCLVYVPRDRYNTEVRHRIEQIVKDGFDARSVESYVQISDSSHARLHVIVRTDPVKRSKADLGSLERQIADAALTYADRLRNALIEQHGEAAGLALASRYRRVFPVAYEEDVSPQTALADVIDLEALRAQPRLLRLTLHRPAGQKPLRLHLKITKTGEPVPISDLLPMLENFGLRVIAERPYELSWPEGGSAWIQDFELEHRDGFLIEIPHIEGRFTEALSAILSGEAENDGFNRLLLTAHLSAREILIVRAYCRYLLQAGVPFSQAYMEQALAANPGVAASLVKLFQMRFDPQLAGHRKNGKKEAEQDAQNLTAEIRSSLDAVASLDEDRILRAYLLLIEATLRTNFYQRDSAGLPKSYLALKLDSGRIPELPQPRPRAEIFVHSARVEAVHLRMGPVARGGIRWSDRREDFRTEVLGLMKAQNVKNTLIVPVGAKGGFIARRLAAVAREDVQAEVIACYQSFIRALLDLTDNIVAGRIVPPPSVVRHDADDPYLVVAADKGTASFSDIANAISAEYGFWLGDAFASGGSAGYDHKKMGITARGAWECVKRHFRELDMDIQASDFTVAGIGDLSGDVFGNGMLLSRHIRLQAAFDHRHIFLDPDPDPAVSFAERERLFALPRSSWDDYDRKQISRGGGVFPRSAKSIELGAEARALLGLETSSGTPAEIIRAILKMPVDLLWNGGIGTYVKASTESHADIGDRTNDSLRINGRELKAKVVGEGGNLGLSQRGRIEYARAGGKLNTDFIDNSAGVNTSDVEVNIKILVNPLVQADKLGLRERNRLLMRMTSEIASLVLRNNYLQSQALSTLELRPLERLTEWEQLIRTLEREAGLNRALEALPSDEQIAERRKSGSGLTRPELALLLAYSKIWLSRHLIESDVPEDPYLAAELERYFPAPLRERFPRAIAHHRLRREIIATATTNSVVNRMGPAFVPRAQEDTGSDPAQIARAYTAAREIFDMREVWAHIEALDNKIPSRLQYEVTFETIRLLKHVTYWLLANRKRALQVDAAVAELRHGVRELEAAIGELLTGSEHERFARARGEYVKAGLPHALAARVASLRAHDAALDIVELARAHGIKVADAAHVYFEASAHTGVDWLREEIEKLPVEGPWQTEARAGLRDAALRISRRLADRVLGRKGSATAPERVTAWLASAGEEWSHWQRMLAQMRTAKGAPDFATLSVGIETVRKLAS